LIPGEKIALEETTAVVDEALCSGCRACIGVCPYKAIEFDHMHHNAKINELLCRGCGACAAICPSSAIEAKHFTDEQISEEIRGLVRVA
jgi:heterodisulfide reductase subunit A